MKATFLEVQRRNGNGGEKSGYCSNRDCVIEGRHTLVSGLQWLDAGSWYRCDRISPVLEGKLMLLVLDTIYNTNFILFLVTNSASRSC